MGGTQDESNLYALIHKLDKEYVLFKNIFNGSQAITLALKRLQQEFETSLGYLK